MSNRIDLNALIVFNAVMTEQSITRAADVLALTQPAVSNTLARLRLQVKDQLFFKAGRGIQPTAKAVELWGQISPSLLAIEQALLPAVFEPLSAKNRFRIAATDIMVQQIWAPLRQLLESRAPGVDLLAYPYRIAEAPKMLANSEIDLCLGVFPKLSEQLRSTFLYRSEFVLAMSSTHPLARRRISIKEFCSAEHLLVSLSGDPLGSVDQILKETGRKRRVAVTVNSFGAALALLRKSSLVGVVPMDLVRDAGSRSGLYVTKPPIDVPPAMVSMAWHMRNDRNAAQSWMRKQLVQIASALDTRPGIKLDR